MRFTASVVFPVFLVFSGCKPPPDAPTTLDDLCGYMFSHFEDEDSEALEVSMQNLYDWMTVPANLETTLEGYQVSKLDEATVEALDSRDHNLDELMGAAVGTEGPDPVVKVADTLILVEPEILSPGTYNSYVRTFDPDRETAECFVAQDPECPEIAVHNELDNTYFIINVVTSTNGQYRWVETDSGMALLQRTWLGSPAEISPEGLLSVDDQYYLNVVMPDGGGALRLQATWVVSKILIDGMDIQALDWAIQSMQSMYEDVDTYNAENPETGLAVVSDSKGCNGCATGRVPSGTPWILTGLLAGAAILRRRIRG